MTPKQQVKTVFRAANCVRSPTGEYIVFLHPNFKPIPGPSAGRAWQIALIEILKFDIYEVRDRAGLASMAHLVSLKKAEDCHD